MPLSESERRVLDDLEQHLRPSVPSRAIVRWWGITPAKRILAASAAVWTGLLTVSIGLSFTGPARVVLVLMAYLLIVGGTAAAVTCMSRSRRESGRPRTRLDHRATRYLR